MSKETVTTTTKKTLVPEIRFEGARGDWTEKKVGNFYYFKNGLNKGKEYFGYGYPIVNYTDVFNKRTLVQEDLMGKVSVDNQELSNNSVQKGDIIFTRTSETLEEIGYPAVIIGDVENTVFSGFLLRARAYNEDPLINQFKSYVFFTEFFRQEMKNKSSISTRALTSGTSISKMFFRYPDTLSEQKYIGKFMVDLDRGIAELEQLITKLQNFKQAMLQKLFPKEGEKEPEMRFEGFEGEWEEKKIKDIILKGGSGGTPTSTNPFFYDGDIPFLSITDITNSNGLILRTDKKITQEGLDNSTAYMVPKGSVSLAMYASVGKVAVLGVDAATSQAFYNMEFESAQLAKYAYVYLSKVDNERGWDKMVSTGTQANLNADKVKNYSIMMPGEEEISVITSFFNSLNESINLKQAELKKLKQFKQAMLSKLFV